MGYMVCLEGSYQNSFSLDDCFRYKIECFMVIINYISRFKFAQGILNDHPIKRTMIKPALNIGKYPCLLFLSRYPENKFKFPFMEADFIVKYGSNVYVGLCSVSDPVGLLSNSNLVGALVRSDVIMKKGPIIMDSIRI